MDLNNNKIIDILSSNDISEIKFLREQAESVLMENCGEKVFLRGLIEFSNICQNDCYYCGIRKSNSNINRYFLKKDEVLSSAIWSANNGYASIVLQSGERKSPKFIDYLCDVVADIKQATISEKLPNGLGITLSVGEQSKETYQRFFDSGAHRFLLRIETSNPELYSKIHPNEMSFNKRLNCLYILKEIGYQVGTGVMIGIPGQTIEDLANDLSFFKEMDVDMIGMGPFIFHEDSPDSFKSIINIWDKKTIYILSLKMIALARIMMKNINIAATTALQAMYPFGREEALRYGANIIMPLLTPTEVRKEYQLYSGKPCLDEFVEDCRECVINRIESQGRKVGYDDWGDSRHFLNKGL